MNELYIKLGKCLYALCRVPKTDSMGQPICYQKDNIKDYLYHDSKENLHIGRKLYRAGDVKQRHIKNISEFKKYYENSVKYGIKLIRHNIKDKYFNHFVAKKAKDKILKKGSNNHD